MGNLPGDNSFDTSIHQEISDSAREKWTVKLIDKENSKKREGPPNVPNKRSVTKSVPGGSPYYYGDRRDPSHQPPKR